MELKLFVDDMRNEPNNDWIIAREITQAIKLLATQNITAVSLDHDIAIQRWVPNNRIKIDLMTENYTAVAWYIAAMSKAIRPKTVFIHTSNPLGREHIEWILKDKVDKIIHVFDYEHEKYKYNEV